VEVHRPHGPFHSWPEFLVEIATIVLGVVIALSFEGAREWYHNRALAHDAREAIAREIADNKKSVDGDLRNVDERKKQLDEALQFADEVLAKGKTTLRSMSLNASLGDLSAASWQTADHTGALAQMSYAEVQKYAAAYMLQEQYQAQERRTFEHLSDALSLVSSVFDPTKSPRSDVEHFRTQVLALNGDLYMERQLAQQLSERYAQVLKD
jgi:hypothetical protein